MSNRSRVSYFVASGLAIVFLMAWHQVGYDYTVKSTEWFQAASPDASRPPASLNIAALHRALLSAETGNALSVVGIGGSVTASHGHKSYGEFLSAWLNLTFPPSAQQHRYHNKGVSGATSAMRSLCVDTLLGDLRPDLLLLEFAVNDAQDSVTGPASSATPLHPAENIERLVRRALSFDPPIPVILVELGMSRRNDIWRGKPLVADDPRLKLPNIMIGAGSRHASVALHYGIPIVDGAAIFREYSLQEAAHFFLDGIHMFSAGHAVVAALIAQELREQLRLAKLGVSSGNMSIRSVTNHRTGYSAEALRTLGFAPGTLSTFSPLVPPNWHGVDCTAFDAALLSHQLYQTDLPPVLFERAASLNADGWQCWLGMYGQPPSEVTIKPQQLNPYALGGWVFEDETGDRFNRKAGWQTKTIGATLILKAEFATTQIAVAYFKTYKAIGTATLRLSAFPVLNGSEKVYLLDGHWEQRSQQLSVELLDSIEDLLTGPDQHGIFLHFTLERCPPDVTLCTEWFKVYGILQR